MKEIIESYFRERSLVNHQLASYNDCIPSADSQSSRFEEIVRNIRIGTEEVLDDDWHDQDSDEQCKLEPYHNLSPRRLAAQRPTPG